MWGCRFYEGDDFGWQVGILTTRRLESFEPCNSFLSKDRSAMVRRSPGYISPSEFQGDLRLYARSYDSGAVPSWHKQSIERPKDSSDEAKKRVASHRRFSFSLRALA